MVGGLEGCKAGEISEWLGVEPRRVGGFEVGRYQGKGLEVGVEVAGVA